MWSRQNISKIWLWRLSLARCSHPIQIIIFNNNDNNNNNNNIRRIRIYSHIVVYSVYKLLYKAQKCRQLSCLSLRWFVMNFVCGREPQESHWLTKIPEETISILQILSIDPYCKQSPASLQIVVSSKRRWRASNRPNAKMMENLCVNILRPRYKGRQRVPESTRWKKGFASL